MKTSTEEKTMLGKFYMKSRSFVLAALVVAFALAGCATPTRMAFQNNAERLTENSAPVYLMAVTIRNTYRTMFQPRLLVVNVEKAGGKEVTDRLNFTMDDKATNNSVSDEIGNRYLIRLMLEPGRYEIRGLTSLARSFPINGLFFTPMNSSVESSGTGVFYIGHVTATVRERQGNEFKAGPTIPLIDQAIAGASGGTFDVVISDEFATDEEAFRFKFPALAGVTIKKAVLAPFDRAKAQQWWETH
jgi:hypothetical protein